MAMPLTPDQAMKRAAALFGAGQFAEAQRLGEAILHADARHFYALHLLAAIAAKRGDFAACAELASRALAIDPRHVEVLCNRGAALRRLGRLEESLADYDRALAIAPASVDAWNNRGVALAALNRHGEALESYAKSLDVNPANATARFNRGLSRLTTGDLLAGWEDQEWRWTGSDTQGPPRPFSQPQWSGGEDIRGKTILLHAEQGLGDALQFCRYAPLVHARGAKVALEVHAPLRDLLSTLPGTDKVLARGDPLPAFDLHCPLLSLPRAFKTGLGTIPAAIPYLAASGEDEARWRARLGERRQPRVGIAWSGGMTLANDRNRSIALAQLAPIRMAGFELVSLQKEIRERDRAALGTGAAIRSFESQIDDFRDTAALVSLVDVVVSVDTAVAHLAGAMGKKTWILLPFAPDWRWLLGRDDSPWYPTARLFRQPRPGDWTSVLERVAAELQGFDGR